MTIIITMPVSEMFEMVTTKVKALKSLPLSGNVKLRLYGLYKGATLGTAKQSNESAPLPINIVGRKKWKAWTACDGISKEECQLGYVLKLVTEIDCELGKEACMLLKDFEIKC